MATKNASNASGGQPTLSHIILEVFADLCEIDVSTCTDDTTIKELGLDSLEMTEMLIGIEDRLDCDLPFEVLEHLEDAKTVGEVIHILEAYIPAVSADSQLRPRA